MFDNFSRAKKYVCRVTNNCGFSAVFIRDGKEAEIRLELLDYLRSGVSAIHRRR